MENIHIQLRLYKGKKMLFIFFKYIYTIHTVQSNKSNIKLQLHSWQK